MKFEFAEYHRHATDDELLDDIKRVANSLQRKHLSMKEYDENGQFSHYAAADRFGSWNNALVKAGLEMSTNRQFTDDELFANLESVWIKKGVQPVRKDMDNKTVSSISSGAYKRRFGTWNNALQEFVKAIGKEDNAELSATNFDEGHSTARIPNLRLRFRVMQRDCFRCCLCGASPASDFSVKLHVDHIEPWSKGGETTLDNLQTLCSKCNLGKGDLE